MESRRSFITKMAVTAGAPALFAGRIFGQEPAAPAAPAAAPKLEMTDPMAVALGYNADTTKVDGAKYPNHKPDQKCSGCALYVSTDATAKEAPCSAFQNKVVAAAGWCAAFAPKPAAAPAAPAK